MKKLIALLSVVAMMAVVVAPVSASMWNRTVVDNEVYAGANTGYNTQGNMAQTGAGVWNDASAGSMMSYADMNTGAAVANTTSTINVTGCDYSWMSMGNRVRVNNEVVASANTGYNTQGNMAQTGAGWGNDASAGSVLSYAGMTTGNARANADSTTNVGVYDYAWMSMGNSARVNNTVVGQAITGNNYQGNQAVAGAGWDNDASAGSMMSYYDMTTGRADATTVSMVNVGIYR